MQKLTDRFGGPSGREALLESLRKQVLVAGNRGLAAAFADKGELVLVAAGKHLVTQGDWDTDFYFIIAGTFCVVINGQTKASRSAGEHVGELVALSSSRPRTASLVAKTECLVLKVSLAALNEITEENAEFWRALADVVADRLEQRNREIGTLNESPRFFIISSSEGLDVARAFRLELSADGLHVALWNKGIFTLSEYPISDLEDAIEAADFTISVVRADDILISRDKAHPVARDNVHLEYGISIGKLGRVRSVLAVDADVDVKLPSDTSGLTTVRFRGATKADITRTVAIACDQIRNHVEQHGVRQDRRSSIGR